MNDIQEQISQLQTAVARAQSLFDSLGQSSSIPREVEMALRVRLGLTSVTQAIAVGGIYINTTNVNPATELGYGTWSALSSGKVLVNYKSGDSDFGTMGATGGEKTHVLTTTEIPSHTHTTAGTLFGSNGGSLSGFGNPGGTTTTTSSSTGSDGAHNNLQPFLVVAMWQRTA